MSKQSLNIHKNNLVNSTRYEQDLINQKSFLQQRIDKCHMNNEFAKLQIEEAERLGKDAFDSERFLVKKRGLKNE
jgi:hypothetical protein